MRPNATRDVNMAAPRSADRERSHFIAVGMKGRRVIPRIFAVMRFKRLLLNEGLRRLKQLFLANSCNGRSRSIARLGATRTNLSEIQKEFGVNYLLLTLPVQHQLSQHTRQIGISHSSAGTDCVRTALRSGRANPQDGWAGVRGFRAGLTKSPSINQRNVKTRIWKTLIYPKLPSTCI